MIWNIIEATGSILQEFELDLVLKTQMSSTGKKERMLLKPRSKLSSRRLFAFGPRERRQGAEQIRRVLIVTLSRTLAHSACPVRSRLHLTQCSSVLPSCGFNSSLSTGIVNKALSRRKTGPFHWITPRAKCHPDSDQCVAVLINLGDEPTP